MSASRSFATRCCGIAAAARWCGDAGIILTRGARNAAGREARRAGAGFRAMVTDGGYFAGAGLGCSVGVGAACSCSGPYCMAAMCR